MRGFQFLQVLLLLGRGSSSVEQRGSPSVGQRVIDLRGQSAEEAISQLEMELDAASLGQEERVKVVHGHGTEKLKRSVRSYLSRCLYVQNWDAGTSQSGGDGLTWVFLKK